MTDGYYSYYTQATGSYIWPATGTVAFPQQTIQIVDPTIYAIASFFTQLLQTNLLPRFSSECIACKLTHANLDAFVDGTAVAQTIVFPLNEQLLKINEFRFPLLAIQPVSEEYINFTLTKLSTERSFKIAWILPPLTPFQYNRLYPFFNMASKTLLAYGSQGYDPKVTPVGPSIWNQIGISFGFLDGVSYEPYEGLDKSDGRLFFPCMEFGFTIVERNQNPVNQNYPNSFTQINEFEIDLYDGYNPANPIKNFADGIVNPNIVITSCTPATGTIQGNTLVVIQGQGFDPAKIVGPNAIVLDGSPARQFVVRSPTVIQAITNASPQYPVYTGSVGPIIITDYQGNTYSLASGYAYSVP